MLPLFEECRPRRFRDVIGQDKAIGRIRTIAKRGLCGRAYWIAGKSGTGKTTIALLLASKIAEPQNVVELDSADLTPAKLRDIEHSAQVYGMGAKSGRAFILNEAHGLRRDTVRQLLVWLERLPRHVVVIFTTTNDGQAMLFDDCDDSGPLLSRCVKLQLTSQGLAEPFAAAAAAIADKHGLNGKPLDEYVKLARRCGNNFRSMLCEIESGAMLG